MRINFKTVVVRLLVLTLFAIILTGSNCRPRQNTPSSEPELSSFGTEPNIVCTNRGLPIIRVSWAVTNSNTTTCLSNFKLNGNGVSGDIWSAGIQNGRCGENNYSRETTINLRTIMGDNIPSTINITADLTRQVQAGVFISSEILDSGSATITSQFCEFSTQPN